MCPCSAITLLHTSVLGHFLGFFLNVMKSSALCCLHIYVVSLRDSPWRSDVDVVECAVRGSQHCGGCLGADIMKRILALLCFAVLGSGSVCAGSPTSNETRYTFLIQGNKAGFETSKHNADGSLELYYEFNDRGRGPKITEKVILDSDGLPIQIVNTGNDLDGKAPVDERFALKDRAASWKNRA